MESKRLMIDGEETPYLLYEDGTIYSEKRKRFLKGHETEGKTREEAEREGRTPCRVCNPYELLPDESDSVAQQTKSKSYS